MWGGGNAIAAVTFAACIAAAGLPANADDVDEAQYLLDRAIEISDRARTMPPNEALLAYIEAVAHLDLIVELYPRTELAVLLVTDQPIGHFQPWIVRHERQRLAAQAGASAEADASADLPEIGENPCGDPCEWELSTGAADPEVDGDLGMFFQAVTARSDHGALVIGTRYARPEGTIAVYGLDPFGEILWTKEHQGDVCVAVPAGDGAALVVESDDDHAIARVDADGDIAWSRAGAPRSNYYGLSAAQDGTILAAGEFIDGDTFLYRPLVQAFDADGNSMWTWRGSEIEPALNTAAVAVTALPDGGSAVMVSVELPGEPRGQEQIWLAKLNAAGTQVDLMEVSIINGVGTPDCNFGWQTNYVLPMADGGMTLVFPHEVGERVRTTSILRFDPAGLFRWSRGFPELPPADEAPEEAEARIELGPDDLHAVAVTQGGNLLMTGFNHAPMRRGGGFAQVLDSATGDVLRRIDLRRTDDDDRAIDGLLSGLDITPDGDALIAVGDGLRTFQLGARVFRIDLATGE